jgi:hypothetical protein
MRFTVSFANPFIMTAYTGAALAIGWAAGAHWDHTTTAVWMLTASAILLYLHDVAIGIVLAMAIAKAASSNPT